MDFKETYQVSNFAITIGWSDAERKFYTQVQETDAPSDREPIQRSIESPTDALRLLDRLSETIAELTGIEEFYPSQHDIAKLMDAPKIQAQPLSVEDFLANPGQYMDASGTIFPDGQLPSHSVPFRQDHEVSMGSTLGGSERATDPFLQIDPVSRQEIVEGFTQVMAGLRNTYSADRSPSMPNPQQGNNLRTDAPADNSFEAFIQFIDGDPNTWANEAEREDIEQEISDALNELHFCVDVLEGWQDADNAGVPSEIDGTLADRQSDLLARTAMNLIINVQVLIDYFPLSQIGVFATASESRDLVSYETLFTETQQETIDSLTTILCRTPLSAFPQSVARGFSPVDGVPFAADPTTYNPAQLFPYPETEELYERNGLSTEQAAEVARIQRMDLRDRTDEEWVFLNEQRELLLRRHGDSERQ